MAEYISRETTIKLLQSMADNAEANGFSYDREVIECVMATLAGIPAADVAPVVHGRWSNEMVLVKDSFGNMRCGYRCSICKGVFNKYAYCGGCGAKMGEDKA